MPSTYEFWLTDDQGRRLLLLDDYTAFSYSRSVIGFGTLEIFLPYKPLAEKIFPVFQPDRRIDVWRSPDIGYPMRREQTYILRMPRIYIREDGVQIIAFYGRDPKDLLRRRYIIQASGTQWTRKTDHIDDMMKAIVREQMLYGHALDPDGVLDPDRYWPQGEFMVQGDLALGPMFIYNFGDRNVLDTMKDLRDASAQLALDNPAYNKIYFDVVPYDLASMYLEIQDEITMEAIQDENGFPLLDERSSDTMNGIGFIFQTYATLRGDDRTNSGLIFSQENNNLKAPSYSKSHLDEVNTAIVKGFGRGDSREYAEVQYLDNVHLSRWNRCEGYVDASNEPDQTNLADQGEAMLYKNRPDEQLNAVFLNVPAGPDSPRSLYGVDWDLGDLLPVQYAGQRFNVEVDIVYIAIDEQGRENITGRNSVNSSSEV